MQRLSIAARLVSAAAATATTVGLLYSVVAIAEPQRSMLIAKGQPTVRVAATVPTADSANAAKASR